LAELEWETGIFKAGNYVANQDETPAAIIEKLVLRFSEMRIQVMMFFL